MNLEKKYKSVLVLYGGISSEREVSLKYAPTIIDACKKIGYETEGLLVGGEISEILPTIKSFDFVFISLLGIHYEDGHLQKILEDNNIKYNGSNSDSSRICFNKSFSKSIVKENNILTPDWILLDDKKKVVKPNKNGSSIGLNFYDTDIIIEKYIEGREITVSILDDKALPIVEIKPKSGIYDYHSKYTNGASEYTYPANINNSLSNEIKNTALKIHKLLKCDVYSRVDFKLDKNNKLWFLEINTLPAMTELSLFPMAAKSYGLSFKDLINEIIILS